MMVFGGESSWVSCNGAWVLKTLWEGTGIPSILGAGGSTWKRDLRKVDCLGGKVGAAI